MLFWLLYRDWPKMYLIAVDRHPKENSGEGFAVTRNLCEKTLLLEETKYSYSRVLFLFLISSGWYLPYHLQNYCWVLEKNNHSSICIWRVWKWPNRQKRTSSSIPPPGFRMTAIILTLSSHLCFPFCQEYLQNKYLFTAFPNSSGRLTFAFLTAAYSQVSHSLGNLYPLLIGKDTKNSCYEHGCL